MATVHPPRMEYDREAMVALAEAFSSTALKYKFSISPHPQKECTFRVIFSRPTFQSPESPVFVTLELTMVDQQDNKYEYKGQLENTQWPILFSVSDNKLVNFPAASIDRLWSQKMTVRKKILWT